MISSDFHYRDKIPVAILGATGCVGQKFVQMIDRHPWFQIVSLCASERSVGRPYGEAVNWLMSTELPQHLAEMKVEHCFPNISGTIAFSGLDSSVAGSIETQFAKAGYCVISNCRNHRMDEDVPLVIGEVNAGHLELVKSQDFGKGMIVTNPNCSALGLTLALKPLFDRFGIESVHVTTLQSVSGAGYPGVPSLDILDNVIPYIQDEEEKVETEPLKILGKLEKSKILPADLKISAHCYRVPVIEGHSASISIKLRQQINPLEIIATWKQFKSLPQEMQLPSAPFQPIHYFEQNNYPQPKLHRSLDKEMAVSIGRLRPCPILDYKFNILSHNTVRGAVGSALLNAELLVRQGYIFW